ncbi:MAG: hypothetical protein HXS44_10065 [Theionarchaea archaeon]|nr:hypothetical protein [Theionarchaea archaeon]
MKGTECGADYMLTSENQDKRCNARDTSENEQRQFFCPVCGKVIGVPHLPDIQSVVTDGWYNEQKTRIIDSQVLLHHEFPHYYDEEKDRILKDSHDITAVIRAQFNFKGDCCVFDILKLQKVSLGVDHGIT